jgi:hypothetical protein
MKVRLYGGIAAAAAAIGGLGMAGAASASPAVTASIPVAHCNVILVGGYSPCFHRPIGPINPGGPMKSAPVAAAS